MKHSRCRRTLALGQPLATAYAKKSACGTLSHLRTMLVRGRKRSDAVNVWGWGGRPVEAPPPQRQATVAKAAARPARAPPPAKAPASLKIPFETVWSHLTKYEVSWANEEVVLLKAFFVEMGPRYKSKVPNCSKIVAQNRGHPLNWRANVHYGRARSKAEVRPSQGGGNPPLIVSKTALKAYYLTL